VTSHYFRKTVATLMDEAGLSARSAADQLGHAKPSLTADIYVGRKKSGNLLICLQGQAHPRPLERRDDLAQQIDGFGYFLSSDHGPHESGSELLG
jgi:integrase